MDIWQAGCLLYHLVTGKELFRFPEQMSREDSSFLHLGQMVSMIGLPPADFSGLSLVYFKSDGTLTDSVDHTLWESFWNDRHAELPNWPEKEIILDLLFLMLKWKPEERPTAGKLLEHAFFQEDEEAAEDDDITQAEGSVGEGGAKQLDEDATEGESTQDGGSVNPDSVRQLADQEPARATETD